MIDAREVRAAVTLWNRMQAGDDRLDVERPPIQILEDLIEQFYTDMRALSELSDEIDQFYEKGGIASIVSDAAQPDDYPTDSNYPKSWWLDIQPAINRLRAHFNAAGPGGESPNEKFYKRPPKRGPVANNEVI